VDTRCSYTRCSLAPDALGGLPTHTHTSAELCASPSLTHAHTDAQSGFGGLLVTEVIHRILDEALMMRAVVREWGGREREGRQREREGREREQNRRDREMSKRLRGKAVRRQGRGKKQ
jgi:hypothetical protein